MPLAIPLVNWALAGICVVAAIPFGVIGISREMSKGANHSKDAIKAGKELVDSITTLAIVGGCIYFGVMLLPKK